MSAQSPQVTVSQVMCPGYSSSTLLVMQGVSQGVTPFGVSSPAASRKAFLTSPGQNNGKAPMCRGSCFIANLGVFLGLARTQCSDF